MLLNFQFGFGEIVTFVFQKKFMFQKKVMKDGDERESDD